MNDVDMASGTKEGIDVHTGASTLNFTTRMQTPKIPDWWVTHVRNDEMANVTVDANVRTSLLGGQNFDLQQERQVTSFSAWTARLPTAPHRWVEIVAG